MKKPGYIYVLFVWLLLFVAHAAQAQLRHVPVLCYHQVRDRNDRDSKNARHFIMPVERFKEQVKMLHDSGYHTILPDELIDHMARGASLPAKPVLLTFDDGTVTQYTNAINELDKYGFKAVFFIMTVTLDRPGYLSSRQVKAIADKGHIIGCHTWDHHDVTHYTGDDWQIQLVRPTARLAQISGTAIKYFAYPFGSWNAAAIMQLEKNGYSGAFQLGGKADDHNPLYTIRRLIADGNWSAQELAHAMKKMEQ